MARQPPDLPNLFLYARAKRRCKRKFFWLSSSNLKLTQTSRLSAPDSFSRFLALYKFVCMYVGLYVYMTYAQRSHIAAVSKRCHRAAHETHCRLKRPQRTALEGRQKNQPNPTTRYPSSSEMCGRGRVRKLFSASADGCRRDATVTLPRPLLTQTPTRDYSKVGRQPRDERRLSLSILEIKQVFGTSLHEQTKH